MKTKFTNEQIRGRLSLAQPLLDFSNTQYSGSTSKIKFICQIHGEGCGYFQTILQVGCVKCNADRRKTATGGKDSKYAGIAAYIDKKSKVTKEEWEKWAKSNLTLDFSKAEYLNTTTKVNLRCITHDIWFLGNPKTLVKNKTPNCPICVKEKITARRAVGRTDDEKLAIMNRLHNSEYQYALPLPRLTHEHMSIFCKKHGEFRQSFHNHVDLGTHCPVCAKTASKGELEVREFVKSICSDVVTKDRKQIYPKEIDIFIEQRKLGIEYHGLYRHAGDNLAHRKKYELCQEKGIRLIQIFEDEWKNKREIVEDLIRSALGARAKTQARETTFCEVSNLEASGFLAKYHINGYASASHKFGLRDKNAALCAVLTLGKPRFDTSAELEIIRYATAMNLVGGFEKIFKNAIKSVQAKSVVTYADLRLGTGNTYQRAGFAVLGTTEPDYWWWKARSERLPRYKTQKHRLETDARFSSFYAKERTEKEICELAGYAKVVGVGHKKFMWKQ